MTHSETTFTYYSGVNGTFTILPESMVGLLNLLRNFKIKSASFPIGYTMTTGSSNVTYTVSGTTVTISGHHPALQNTCLNVNVVEDKKIELVKKKGFSKEAKLKWRKQWLPQRNTGRK